MAASSVTEVKERSWAMRVAAMMLAGSLRGIASRTMAPATGGKCSRMGSHAASSPWAAARAAKASRNVI
jgi:hypothetical protein